MREASDEDIASAAAEIVRESGISAPDQARYLAGVMGQAGNWEHQITWLRIALEAERQMNRRPVQDHAQRSFPQSVRPI